MAKIVIHGRGPVSHVSLRLRSVIGFNAQLDIMKCNVHPAPDLLTSTHLHQLPPPEQNGAVSKKALLPSAAERN